MNRIFMKIYEYCLLVELDLLNLVINLFIKYKRYWEFFPVVQTGRDLGSIHRVLYELRKYLRAHETLRA